MKHIFDIQNFPSVTPPKLFRMLREKFGTPTALLESLEIDEKNNMSLLACDAIQELDLKEKSFDKIREALKKCEKFDVNFPFRGGLLGMLHFEIFDEIEPSLASFPGVQHGLLYEFSRFVFFDHLQGLITFLNFEESEAKDLLNQAGGLLDFSFDERALNDDMTPFDLKLSQSEFEAAVEKLKEHIFAGDIFQAICSNEFSRDIGDRDGLEFYELLRVLEPSTHLVFYDFGDKGQVGSASPEILGVKRGDQVLYSPIAGTRYRGKDEVSEQKILEEMRQCPKENAEHDMLIDLGRNDLGRVCVPGSVRLAREKYVKKFANVIHLVSDLEGVISDDVDAVDFFKAIFPAGTLTGAPKIRAIDLIRSVETSPRGLYGGALGYFSADGNMDFTIAIRSFFRHNNRAFFRVGGGIVQDSIPSREWLEVHNKAKSLIKVFNAVCAT